MDKEEVQLSLLVGDVITYIKKNLKTPPRTIRINK